MFLTIVPDVLIFEDKEFTKLKEIHEVKPFKFVYEEKQNEYHIITKAKLNILKEYCKENNLDYRIITELDLEGYHDESNKDFKKRLQRIKKSLLSI